MENSDRQERSIEASLVLRMFWIAMMISVVVLGVMLKAFITSDQANAQVMGVDVNDVYTALTVALLLAVVLFYIAYKVPNYLLKSKTDEKSLAGRYQTTFAAFMVRYSLIEAVALIGFVVGLISRDVNFYMTFAVACLTAFIVSYPRRPLAPEPAGHRS